MVEKMRIMFLILFTSSIIVNLARADIINIPGDLSTIQAGIDTASEGDTVLVQPGIYRENINFNGHNITVSSLYLTTGESNFITNTIIDGDSVGSVVAFESNETTEAVLYGFTIANGYALYGGGVYCKDSSPTISYNYIDHNSSNGFGGALFCENSSAMISENVFTNNLSLDNGGAIYCLDADPMIIGNNFNLNMTQANGGAIYFWYSDPIVSDNTIAINYAGNRGGAFYMWQSNPQIIGNFIRENSAERYGGAMYIYISSPIIYGNFISENQSQVRGGGLFFWHSTPTIVNNAIVRNSSEIAGGIYCADNSDAIIINNTVALNQAISQAGGFYCRGCSPTLTNNIFWQNSADDGPEFYLTESATPIITFCDILGSYAGEGNIDIDPLFRDTLENDFHLMAIDCDSPFDSPCIDTGHPDSIDAILDCAHGLGGLRADMGAYGGGDSIQVFIENTSTNTPNQICFSQNYPNPFNASTTINYSLSYPGNVKIIIYDILGRKVSTLVDKYQPAGYHQAIWRADDFASGMYFYKLQAGDYNETKKLLLLK